jgi:hypothetical protein
MFKPYTEVALAEDLPEEDLCRGDVVTIVDRVPGPGGDTGYLIEVFNAVGQTIKVLAVPAGALAPLAPDQVLAVRPLAPSAADG